MARQAASGGGEAEHHRRALHLARSWAISPADYYRFILDLQTGAPQSSTVLQALAYVFDKETPAFHHLKNAGFASAVQDSDRLTDKLETEKLLSSVGIDVPETLAVVDRNATAPLASWLLPGSNLFFKRRRGAGGEGAFAAWNDAGCLSGRKLTGSLFRNVPEIEQAWRTLLSLDDVLIQRRLYDHPEIETLAGIDEACTVRLVTRRKDGALEPFCAFLLVPTGTDRNSFGGHAVLPIEIRSGDIQPLPERFSAKSQQLHTKVRSRAPLLVRLPFWSKMVEHSMRAHLLFPGLWGIAWDWIVSPAGPVLLEGNSVWDLSLPQQLLGPALAWQ